ncbi:FecR domain-containing protein [Parabacteroides goldsteinii]|uniref:FecR family protein n=1 Tax=uncultured Parabacteroides sp. TaxID=512312 RepID=UPI00101CF9D8|nr:FecR domain-containing protein [Parabacteroides goldsteinii]
MTDLFNKLYSQFLNGNTDRERFKDFKESLNRLPDTELSQKMEKFWLENENYPAMDIQHKQNIRKKLHEQIIPQQKKTFMYWRHIAAAVAVIALLSVTAWNISVMQKKNSVDPFLAEVPAGNKVQLTLPDKSSVKLNSESTLSYTYQNGKRVVKLAGEAYFHVSKDKEHPFVVQTGDLNIEVLGTSFNVCLDNDNNSIETSLIEGSIRLYDSKYPSETFILKPNQKAIYSGNRKISLYNTDNVKETAWTRDHLVFESEKLSSVFHKIERWYGVNIELKCPEIANDRISGSFKNEQLPYVMEALKIQYGFNYEITGNNVVINKSNKLKNK